MESEEYSVLLYDVIESESEDNSNMQSLTDFKKLSQLDKSQASNIAFLLDWAQMLDLDFGLIQQNISIQKASFQYQGQSYVIKSAP